MREWSYINSAVSLLDGYAGEEPFATYLKRYFSMHPKFGSRDRRAVAHLCYCYFRLGKAFAALPNEERVLAGLYSCSTSVHPVLAVARPEWNETVGLDLAEKFVRISSRKGTSSVDPGTTNLRQVFPWSDELTAGIDHEALCRSLLIQPDLFLRCRPGKKAIVLNKLADHGMPAWVVEGDCLALSNASRMDTVIGLNEEAVVQDLNSQRTMGLLAEAGVRLNQRTIAWDCCAASGGKAIQLLDLYPTIDLTVSDIRASILSNLRRRFAAAGIRQYRSFTGDVSEENAGIPFEKESVDFILCDAPCSGSGTWGRTPEQLFYFRKERIDAYAALQQRILRNVTRFLRPGGHLLYITCSVFHDENEEAVALLSKELGLAVMHARVFTGYAQRADTLFAALLRRPL